MVIYQSRVNQSTDLDKIDIPNLTTSIYLYWNDTNTISGDSASTCSGVAIGLSSS